GQNHQFFADGMHEELLSQLAMIDGLNVTSRTSVERYRGSEASLPSIARELGVDAIVEGSIRVDGDRLRVTVQLIDAKTDTHRWANSYDRQLSVQDIFALQVEVANEIAEALALERVFGNDRSDVLPTNSLEAYNLYLLGRYHTFRQTPDDLEKAVGFLRQAIDIDAEFAAAYAALGWAYSFIGSEYGGSLPSETYPKAKEAALRALSIDANLSDARTLYADILTWYDWDFAAAEREYLKTVELDPLNVLGYALFLSTQERHEEAVALVERRIAAHPNDPYVRINAGWRYLHAGLPDKAIEAATIAAEHRDSASLLGFSRLAQGDSAEAIRVFEAAMASQGRTPSNIANLAMAYYEAGRGTDAKGLLEELEAIAKDNYVSPGILANVYFASGDADRGFASLDRALEERTRDMIFLRVNRSLAGYRNDPRYLELVRSIGLK
ncbi:MAG: tetratricopeptide repeat protein, partial [Pseudomonadota bacterium]